MDVRRIRTSKDKKKKQEQKDKNIASTNYGMVFAADISRLPTLFMAIGMIFLLLLYGSFQ